MTRKGLRTETYSEVASAIRVTFTFWYFEISLMNRAKSRGKARSLEALIRCGEKRVNRTFRYRVENSVSCSKCTVRQKSFKISTRRSSTHRVCRRDT